MRTIQNFKKIFSLILSSLFIIQQTMLIPAFADAPTATNITGISGNNGVYNIDPASHTNQTGFRSYDDFALKQGDIANFIFTHGDGTNLSNFVNLVKNQVQIYGLLNSIRNGNFYNGHVIFVSPNGLVVGSSGVINVGALSVYTPKSLPDINSFGSTDASVLTKLNSLKSNNQGVITVNGKIFTRGVRTVIDKSTGNIVDDPNGTLTDTTKYDITTDGVNLYGKNITVDGGTILAGVANSAAYNKVVDNTVTDVDKQITAENLFKSLVNVDDGTVNGDAFANQNGKIVIQAQDSSNIALSSQSLVGFSSDLSGLSTDLTNASSSASVTINNSTLAADSMDIGATSSATYDVEGIAVPGLGGQVLLDNFDSILGGTYSTHIGPISKATVAITNSKLDAAEDVNLTTSSSSTLSIPTADIVDPSSQQYVYSIGSDTTSTIDVINSQISTNGNVSALATSSNSVDASFSTTNNSTNFTPEQAKITLVSSKNAATTRANIDKDSVVSAQNVSVGAANYSSNSVTVESETELTSKNKIDPATGQPVKDANGNIVKTYPSTVSLSGVLNRSNINTTANVDGKVTATKDPSNTNSTTGAVNVLAQNMNLVNNTASATSSGTSDAEEEAAPQSDANSSGMLSKITSFFNSKASQNTETSAAQAPVNPPSGGGNTPPSESTTQVNTTASAGGSVVINLANVNATASVGNTANIKADTLNVQANTVDLTLNNSTASVSNAKYAPAIALIVNSQNDTTTAQIADGTSSQHAILNIANGINVNATTEMPVNMSSLAEYVELFQNLAAPFVHPNDYWNSGIFSNAVDYAQNLYEAYGDFNPADFSALQVVPGFFNNFAQSSASGTTLGASGSVIYSEVNNITSAHIGDFSNINTSGDIVVNAANKVRINNLAGIFGDLTNFKNSASGTVVNPTNPTSPSTKQAPKNATTSNSKYNNSGTGAGGSLILGFNTQNADSTIGNSVSINTDNTLSTPSLSNIKVCAATDQSYLNVVAGGASGSSTAIQGSAAVTSIKGDTLATIGNNDIINANSLLLSAGKASINLAQTEKVNLGKDIYDKDLFSYELSDIGDDGFIQLDSNQTVVNDKTQVVTIAGALASQTTAQGTKAAGTAIGASINVVVTGKNVKAAIGNDSTISLASVLATDSSTFADDTRDNSLAINANTDSNLVDIAIAGSFTGGVKANKTKQQATNAGSSSGQQTSNQGGWMDKVSSILSKITGFTNSNGSTSNGVTDTTNAAGRTTTVSPSSGTANSTANGASTAANESLNTTTTSSGNKSTSTTDSNGSLGNRLSNAGNLNSSTTNSTTATNQLDVAAAGSINATSVSNNVSASVGQSTITTAKAVKVASNQSANLINVSTGLAKSKANSGSSQVGAGAAINLALNNNSTTSNIGTDSDTVNNHVTVDAGNNAVSVTANDSSSVVNAAVGAAATSNTGNNVSTSAAIGGSFNASAFTNSTKSSIGKYATVKNATTAAVMAAGKTGLINIAGGIAANTSTANSSYGAGVAANINVLNQDTEANIYDGADITSTGALNVSANNTDKLTSVGVAGTIVTGGTDAYTFTGVLGTDVFVNKTKALINNATISSNGLSVSAQNDIGNFELAGAANYTSSQASYSVGTGAIINVIVNDTEAGISGTTVKKAGDLSVHATQNENLNQLAINGTVSNTANGFSIGLNGEINVLASTINSYISNSTISQANNTSVKSVYAPTINAITAVGTVSTGASAASLNLVANILTNNIKSQILNSDLSGTGSLEVNSDADESITVTPAALSVSMSAGSAIAANIAANVVVNDLTADISGSKTSDGSISSDGGVNVLASDATTIKTRGGVLAASGDSTALGGSILVDVIKKNVASSIGDSTSVVASSGDVNVHSTATNTFGIKNTVDFTTLKGITDLIGSGNLSDVGTLADWEMTYDLVGSGNGAAIGGSLIAKTVNNNVSASVGSRSKVTGKSIDINADNETYIRAIVGNITAGNSAAIGASIFVNTLIGSTKANVGVGSTLTSNGIPLNSASTVGNINVKANSTEDLKTIMVSGSGANNVAINGSLNVNTIVDTTKATVSGATLISSNGVNVKANEQNDISSFNVSGTVSGGTSIGVIGYVNTYKNDVESAIKDSGESTPAKSSVSANNGAVNVSSTDSDSFGAIIGMVAVGNEAGIAGLVLANTVVSSINSYISDSNVTASNGNVNVTSNYDFNKNKYGKSDISSYLRGVIDNNTQIRDKDSKQFNAANLLPIVSALNLTGSDNASVGITAIANTISNSVNAYVSSHSSISANNLNIKAQSDIVTYDAMASFAVAGTGAAVPVNAEVNTFLNTTSAYLDGSTVTRGSVDTEATQNTNVNSILVGAAVVAEGGAVAPIVTNNVLGSTTSARITNSQIENSDSVTVKANSTPTVNTFSVVGAGAAIGGAVTGDINTNILLGTTEAYIGDTTANGVTISRGNVDVEAASTLNSFDLIAAALVSGVGANVGINVATNVINNNIDAHIKNAILNANTSTTLLSTSTNNLYNTVASCGLNGIGAAVAGTVITNVVDDTMNSYIDTTKIAGDTSSTNDKVSVSSVQTDNLNGGMVNIGLSGLGVAAGADAITNVFTNHDNTYIKDTTISANKGVTVSGTASETIDFITLSGEASTIGAVAGSLLTNVIKTDLEAYTSGGSIDSKGDISVTAGQTTKMKNMSGGLALGGVDVGARSIVNVLSDNTIAKMENTAISNSSSIEVSATSTENITNDNYAAQGGLVSAGIAVLTNVIENKTQAKLDAQSQTVKTAGALSVTGRDTLTLDNTAGIASIGVYSGAMSLNINVINNAVRADLLSTTSGANQGDISAGSVDVNSTSTMNLNNFTASGSLGLTGSLAGTIAVTSIGDGVSSNGDYNSYISGATAKAQNNSTNSSANSHLSGTTNGTSYDYSSNVAAMDLNAGNSTANDGTVANIAANVSSGSTINVNAQNTVQGIGNDTFKTRNVAASGGMVALGASALVTDMKYKTTAQISGGKVTSTGATSVQANNTVKSLTEAAQANVAGLNLGGNVSVFENNANTSALISNAMVQTPSDVSVTANSTDVINTKAFSGSVGLVSGSAVVALSKTSNHTTAQINNSTINGGLNAKANNVNVKAVNTSALTSEMESASISGVSVNALINEAQSNAITSAIVKGTSGNISANKLNVISATDGISAETVMYIGSFTYYGGSVNASGADVESTFNSEIGGTIATANDINVKAGVAESQKDSNGNAEVLGGNIKAKITSLGAEVSYASATVTTLKPQANANTNIYVDQGANITSENNINLYSALNRTSSTSESSAYIGAYHIDGFVLDAETIGTSNINVAGSLVAKEIDLNVNDTNTANSNMLSAELTLAGGNVTYITANVGTDSNISLTSTGSLTADNLININSASSRTAVTSQTSASAKLLDIKDTNIISTAGGSSKIDLNGQIKVKKSYSTQTANGQTVPVRTLNIGIGDNSSAENQSTSFTLSFASANTLASSSNANSSSLITLGGNIDASSIAIDSAISRSAKTSSTSGSFSLASGGYYNIESNISGSSDTGFYGAISTNDLDISSSVANSAATYIDSDTVGIFAAISKGHAKNNIDSSTNYISFYGNTNINSTVVPNVAGTGTVSANAETNNYIRMSGSNGSGGFVAAGSGNLSNYVNSTTGVRSAVGSNAPLNSTNPIIINANDISISSSNKTSTPDTNSHINGTGLYFSDDSGGFIAASGAKIKSEIYQTNDVQFNGNTQLYATDALNMALLNSTDFEQYMSSSSSGAGCYNSVKSDLEVYNRNNITFSTSLVKKADGVTPAYFVRAGNLNITEDVNNKLVSNAKVSASHFAGEPSVTADLTLENYNNINVNSYVAADNLIAINLMGNSNNVATQNAYARVKAAVASSDRHGKLDYTAKNDINISASGDLASKKDVTITYSTGSEDLSSNIEYKHTHYICFGIPITTHGSHSNLNTTRSSSLELNGKIEAGAESHKELAIDSNGNVILNKGDVGFTKNNSSSTGSSSAAASERISELNQIIAELKTEKQQVTNEQTSDKSMVDDLGKQITALQTELAIYKTQLALLNYAGNNSGSTISFSSLHNDIDKTLGDSLGDAYKNLTSDAKSDVINSLLSGLISENANGTFTTYSPTSTQGQSVITNIVSTVKGSNASSADVSNLSSALNAYQFNNSSLNVSIDGNSTTVNVQNYTKQTGSHQLYSYEYYSDSEHKNIVTVTDSASSYSGNSDNLISTSTRTVNDYTTYTIYDDSLAASDLNTLISNTGTSLTNAQTSQQAYQSAYQTVSGKLSDIDTRLSNYDAQKQDIAKNGVNSGFANNSNGSFTFDPMKLSSGGISIKGLDKLSGSGSFVVSSADLLINNYSNYNLIFNGISIGSNNAGVWINGLSYSNQHSVNWISTIANAILHLTGTDKPSVVVNKSTDNAGNITINNWFDASDPTLARGTAGSNMLFLGALSDDIGSINLHNESENIGLQNSIWAQAINIAAAQGDVIINSPDSTLTLNSGNNIVAGKDVSITAAKIVNNGTISAGSSDRNITITDDVLNNATATETVNGVTYKVINITGSKKSAYLNSTNNIKALYDAANHKILLFDINASGGSAILTGNVSGNGSVSYSTGYGKINVDNKTANTLVVNDITNNYYNGSSTVGGAVNKALAYGASASTIINATGTTGDVDLAGFVSSGNYGADATGSGSLSVSADNGSVTVENLLGNSGEQLATIDVTGNTGITAKGITVNGKMNNRLGSTSISNNGSGSLVVANTGIINNNGILTLDNYGTGGIRIVGATTNANGKTTITNQNGADGGINISGTVTNNINGDIELVNNSNGGITVSSTGTVRNNGLGSTSLTNNGTGNITVDKDITHSGNVSNNSGSLTLTNASTGVGDIDIRGSLSNNAGTTTLENKNVGSTGINIESTGMMTNKNGLLSITNKGSKGIIIAGHTDNNSLDTAAHSTEIQNANTDSSKILISGNITNNNGIIDIKNAGLNGVDIFGNVHNLSSGSTSITNTAGGVTVEQGAELRNDGRNGQSITNSGSGNVKIAGVMTNNSGLHKISNSGAGGIEISGTMSNSSGNTEITNELGSAGGVTITSTGAVKNLGVGNTTITNNGNGGITVASSTFDSVHNAIGGLVSNGSGSTKIDNEGTGGISVSGTVNNTAGTGLGNTDITIINANDTGITVGGTVVNSGLGGTSVTNNGNGGITVNGSVRNDVGLMQLLNIGLGDTTINGSLNNSNGVTTIQNTNTAASKIAISETGSVTNNNGALQVLNTGANGINIAGHTTNTNGNTVISAENAAGKGITIDGTVSNTSGNTIISDQTETGIGISIGGLVTNTAIGTTSIASYGKGGISVTGHVSNNTGALSLLNAGLGDTIISGSLNNANGSTTIQNTNTGDSKILINETGSVTNNNGALNISNAGAKGITIAGTVNNNLLSNPYSTTISNLNEDASQIDITSTGEIFNKGLLTIDNHGTNGINIAGNVTNTGNAYVINQKAGDIKIGDASTDNNLYVNGEELSITNNNGSILNAGVDKTLAYLTGNLIMNAIDGNIGSYDVARATRTNLPNKYGVEAATRDYAETFNVNVNGTLTASSKNINKSDYRLVNVRAKNSNLNVKSVKSDGNVILTAADWADSSNDSGYSILNATSSASVANIEGKNISLIASKNIGNSNNALTYNQTSDTDWISAEAEKSIYMKALSDEYNTNIWEMAAKTGDLGLELSGNTTIREITANGTLGLVNRGAKLSIYDLGKMTHMQNVSDDLLYPHDHIALSSVVPDSINLAVLDINRYTRVNPLFANSILNIYNAYVEGLNRYQTTNGVTSRVADVILKADNIYANKNDSSFFLPAGTVSTSVRSYTDNPLDSTTSRLYATGFNTVGNGGTLAFDIRGVNPDAVTTIGRDKNERNYYDQKFISTIASFTNKDQILGQLQQSDYKVKDITLSVNSNSSNTEDRGTFIKYLYADNAYVDTMDTNLYLTDTIINNYSEFRNGNGVSGYQWLTIDDNTLPHKIVSVVYPEVPLTLQLYTAQTGSFNLSMGHTIVMGSVAPAVYYDPYEVANLPHTENSFYRLTYKDDKIQQTTTTPEFADIDKDTYKPTQRTSLRFDVEHPVNYHISSNSAVTGIKDISTTGVLLEQKGSLKVGDKLDVNLNIDGAIVTVQVQIVRVNAKSSLAGAKFINIDKATANRILYMNMKAQASGSNNPL